MEQEPDFMLRKANKLADTLHKKGFANRHAQADQDLESANMIMYLVKRVKDLEQKGN